MTGFREVIRRLPNGNRILLLEDLLQNICVEQGGVHASLGRSAQVSPLEDRLFHLGAISIRKTS